MNALMTCNRKPTSLASIIDDLFADSFIYHPDREFRAASWPRVDIVEKDSGYSISADLPGLDKKDIKVSVENGVLTISGEKEATKNDEKKNRYHYLERSYGSFKRSFALPENVDQEHIEANFKNGVLQLALKKNEKAKPKAIEVKVG